MLMIGTWQLAFKLKEMEIRYKANFEETDT